MTSWYCGCGLVFASMDELGAHCAAAGHGMAGAAGRITASQCIHGIPAAALCLVCEARKEERPAPALEVGRKDDSEKAPWDLVPWRAMTEVVDVLAHGATKYGVDNWRKVSNARRRYIAAMLRHVVAFATGERNDPESGRHHLAHAACCALFLIEGGA